MSIINGSFTPVSNMTQTELEQTRESRIHAAFAPCGPFVIADQGSRQETEKFLNNNENLTIADFKSVGDVSDYTLVRTLDLDPFLNKLQAAEEEEAQRIQEDRGSPPRSIFAVVLSLPKSYQSSQGYFRGDSEVTVALEIPHGMVKQIFADVGKSQIKAKQRGKLK